MITRLSEGVRRCRPWGSFLVAFLSLGLLVCLLALTANVINANIQSHYQSSRSYQDSDSLLIGSWRFASAHSNVQSLQSHRQLSNDIHKDALLLVARYATPNLGLILPLLALFTGLALVRANPALGTLRPIRSYALAHAILSLAVPLVVGVFLVIESRILEIPYSWSQWSRLLVWLVVIGTYFASFLFLGSWISQRVQHVKMAAWIFASLFIAMFMIQSTRGFLMRFDGSNLPPVPDLPTEVRLSLFCPSGEPRVTLDREEMVAEYLDSVDAYSESVHAVIRDRYDLERWWHAISPQLLLYELSYQVLQSQLADIVDVVYSPGGRNPSLAASLAVIWPEAAWLTLLCSLSGLSTVIAARKHGRTP